MPHSQNGSPSTNLQAPAMQHKFAITVEGTPVEFNQQISAFAMNMVRQEFVMLVEQSVSSPTREHIVIQDLIDNPDRLVTLDIIDGNGNVADTIKFEDCVIVDHAADFSLAATGTVGHVITWSYDDIDLGAGKAAAAFSNAMSVVGGRRP